MEIRKGTIEDIPSFERIDDLCFSETLRYSRFDFLYYFFKKNVFSLVAEDEKEICAFLIADTKPPGYGHIITIDVHPVHRRKGLGKVLMIETEKIFSEIGVDKIILEVHESNIIAQEFYSALGYKVEKKLDNFYHTGHGMRLGKNL